MCLKRILPIGLLLVSAISGAQAQRSINIHDHLLIRDSNKYLYGDPVESYEGSPFLNDSYVPGFVYFGKEKLNQVRVPMRYNIPEDLMEFQEGRETYLLEPDPRITKIEIGDQVFVVHEFRLAKKQNGFLELLESGKVALLSKKSVNYRKKNEIQSIPAKYSRMPDVYYCKIGDQPIVKVSSIKSLIESLPDKQKELNEFVKTERTSSKDKDDLVKLVKYYNSLFAVN